MLKLDSVNLKIELKEIYALLCPQCRQKVKQYIVEKAKEAIAEMIAEKLLIAEGEKRVPPRE